MVGLRNTIPLERHTVCAWATTYIDHVSSPSRHQRGHVFCDIWFGICKTLNTDVGWRVCLEHAQQFRRRGRAFKKLPVFCSPHVEHVPQAEHGDDRGTQL